MQLALPIGISFFTFHHISYIVDVYRHSRHAQKSPVQFATYIAMFPQLIAGPIVRYVEIQDRVRQGRSSPRYRRSNGGELCASVLGLAKKIIIADNMGYRRGSPSSRCRPTN